MRHLLPLLLVPALALAEEPSSGTTTTGTTTTTTTTTSTEKAPDVGPQAPPPAEAAPSTLGATIAELQATEIEPVVVPDGALSPADRASLESVRLALQKALPVASEAAAQAKRDVTDRTRMLKVARLEVKTAKSEVKASAAAVKADEAGPNGQGAVLRAQLDAAEHALDEADRKVKVTTAELAWAKALEAHARTVIAEDEAKLAEAEARLEGAEQGDLDKLEKARLKADKGEAVARGRASKAKLLLEKTRTR